ncbi:MAG: amino acid adenylation domain-containing protein, partial [Chitinophagaceae bacterium]
IALQSEATSLSYASLEIHSNRLAAWLQQRHWRNDQRTGIFQQRSVGMVVSMLGILRSGGCYVPLDPAYPDDRLKFMLADSGLQCVIVDAALKERMQACCQGLEIEVITYGEWPQDATFNTAQPQPDRADLAYIIYTSGSTGVPKGVMISHGNLAHFMNWAAEEFAGDPFDVVYACTSICFDISVFELLYPLLCGKRIRVLDDGLSLRQHLGNEQRVLLNTVPSVIHSLLRMGEEFPGVSVLNMAGEPVPQDVYRKLDLHNIRVRNLYGPTEDTIYSTVYHLDKNSGILIGKPRRNSQLYIAGEHGDLKPVGIAGEICLAGPGLSPGYLNLPEKTSVVFVKGWLQGAPDLTVYRTGDLGRMRPDGNIEYIGRKDDQVKIRGYRIELGEIERVMETHAQVSRGVVLVHDDESTGKRLVGYVRLNEGRTLSTDDLKIFMRSKLPEYMIPPVIIVLQHIPETANGKTDKKALRKIAIGELQIDTYEPVRNETDSYLIGLWQQHLGCSEIGINADFFKLGGHSLLAIRIVRSIQQEMGIDINIRNIFRFTTLKHLSDYLSVTASNQTDLSREQETITL